MRTRTVWVVLLVVAVASHGAAVAAADDFGLVLRPDVDTPTRTVEFDGTSYTISAVGRVDPGDPVEVTVSAPSSADYKVLLYDSNEDIVDFERGSGDGYTFSFPTEDAAGDYPPGSYLVTVSHDGVTETVHPLVLSAYHVSVTAPSSATTGTTIDVEASLTEVVGGETIDRVQVVIGNADDERTVEMAEESAGQYATSVTLDTLPPDDYLLYVVVQGPEEVFGKKELIGVSDSHGFTIEESSQGSGGGSGGGQDTTTSSTATPTAATATSTVVVSTSATARASTTGTTAGTPGSAETTTVGPTVITPRSTPTPTVPSQAFPGFELVLLAFVLLLGWRLRTSA